MKRPSSRYWREPRGLALWLLCIAFILWQLVTAGGGRETPERLEEGVHEVRRVVDGDTLVLVSGARVRLQGIDTPETVRENHPVEAWGPEASAFTKDFIERAGGRVRLTFGVEGMDRHNRFLAFVWHGGMMLNEELVREGLANARLDYRYSGTMKRRLSRAQDEARKAERGIWSSSRPTVVNRQLQSNNWTRRQQNW